MDVVAHQQQKPTLFALIDYFKYRLKRGRYSCTALEKAGWKLATRDNLLPFADKFKIGDVLFYHDPNSVRGWMIMYWTDCVASHVAGFVENGQLLDATTSGVMKHPFTDYLDGRSYLCIKTPTLLPCVRFPQVVRCRLPLRLRLLSWLQATLGFWAVG